MMMMSPQPLTFEILRSVDSGVAPHHRSPASATEPAGQDLGAPLAPGVADSTAPIATECQSFLDNVVAQFGDIGAQNYRSGTLLTFSRGHWPTCCNRPKHDEQRKSELELALRCARPPRTGTNAFARGAPAIKTGLSERGRPVLKSGLADGVRRLRLARSNLVVNRTNKTRPVGEGQ